MQSSDESEASQLNLLDGNVNARAKLYAQSIGIDFAQYPIMRMMRKRVLGLSPLDAMNETIDYSVSTLLPYYYMDTTFGGRYARLRNIEI